MLSRRLEFEGIVDVGLIVINPIPSDVMREYHKYVAKRIKT